jgi:hypothetical protein
VAFATSADVEAALGRSLTEDVTELLESASDLVAGYLLHIPDPVPPAVKRAVATMVAAVLTKPDVTVAQYDAGGYNQVREAAGVRVGVESSTTSGPWLTQSIKQRLRPYRRAMVSVLTVGENYGS